MMADVRADDGVEEMGVDKAEVAVDGGCGPAGKGPLGMGVVRDGAIGVLKEGDCYCTRG